MSDSAYGEFRVNTHTDGYQHAPVVADLADGGFVVTWHSSEQDGDGTGIYAQRYDESGTPVGDEIQVNTYTYNDQEAPAVATLADGGFVVTWRSEGQDGHRSGVFAQRHDDTGAAVGSEFQVNTYTDDGQVQPSVAGLANGGFVVTWSSWKQGGDSHRNGIFAQRYDESGAPVDDEFQVNAHVLWDQQSSSVTALMDGGFVVFWESGGDQDGSVYGIFGQRYDAAGVPVGGEFQVNTYTEDSQRLPASAMLTDGGFVVAWQSSEQDGDEDGVYAQRYDSNGTPVGGEFQVNTHTGNAQSDPSVAALSDGGFLVIWGSHDQGGIGTDIYAQRYDENGAPVGGEFQINTTPDGNQTAPSVAALADGGFLIAWVSGHGGFFGTEIYAQRYDASGTAVGVPNDNTAPEAANDTVGTEQNVAVTIDVLANDSDPDGDTLGLASVGDPANGSAIINNDGTITYTPAADFSGEDSFSYTITDEDGATDSATVTINIVEDENAAPVTVADSATVAAGGTVMIDVLANDSDPEGETLTLLSVSDATGGQAELVDGQVRFTAAAGFSGETVLEYEVSDTAGNVANGEVTVTIGQSSIIASFDIDAEGWTTTGDTHSFAYEAAGGNPGGHITAVDQTVGNVWYFQAPELFLGDKRAYQNGTLTFDLYQSATSSQFDDSDVLLVGADLTLAYNTAENPGTDWTHYSVPLTESDWSVGSIDGASATEEQMRSVLSDLQALRIRGEYITGSDFGGLDNVRLCMQGGQANTAPEAIDDAGATTLNTPITLNVLANDSDPDGDAFSLTDISAPANGSAIINNDGTITYTPAADFSGEDSFSYTITDEDGATDSATVMITVERDGLQQPLPKGVPNAYYTLTNTTSEEFFLAIGLDAQLLGDTASKTLNLPTGAIARRLDSNTTVNFEDASTDYILQRNDTTLEVFDSTGALVTSLSASSTETSSLRFSDGSADLTFEGGNLVIGGTLLSDEGPIAGGILSLDDTLTSSGVFTGVTDLAGSAEATAFLTLTDTTPETFTLGAGLVVELFGDSAGKVINIPQGAGADGVDPNTTLYIEGASSVFTFSRNGTTLEVRNEAGYLTASVKGSSAETSTLVFADGSLELAVADQQLTLGGTTFTDGLSVSGADLTVDPSETSEGRFGSVVDLDALGGTVQNPASADAGDGVLTFFDNVAFTSHTEINDFGADDTLMLQGASAADVDVSVADDATTFAFDNGAGDVSQIVLLGVAGPFTSVAQFNASDSFGDVIFA